MNGDIGSDIPRTRRIKVIDINPHLMCVLCGGYYVDATTIIECLHSFCKSCIVRYLDTSKFCPICDVQVHKTKPLLNIRSDQTLQDIVYKLVPGLFQREMKRRREFYAKLPPEALKNSLPKSNEERGEVDYAFPHNIFSPDEFVSIALEYSANGGISNGHDPTTEKSTKVKVTDGIPFVSRDGLRESIGVQKACRRYLRCPIVITVAHIKKLIRAKYGLSPEQRVDLMFSRDCLNDEFMIMDIAYMYAWKRKGPLNLYYRIFDRSNKRLKTCHGQASPPVDVSTVFDEIERCVGETTQKNTKPLQTGDEELERKASETSLGRPLQQQQQQQHEKRDRPSSGINGVGQTESVTANIKVTKNSVNDGLVLDETEKSVGEGGKMLRKDKEDSKQSDVVQMETKPDSIETSECKLSVDRADDGACETKKNGDFNRNKVNGIKSNGTDGVDSKEIQST